jgi:hypothetical protein
VKRLPTLVNTGGGVVFEWEKSGVLIAVYCERDSNIGEGIIYTCRLCTDLFCILCTYN